VQVRAHTRTVPVKVKTPATTTVTTPSLRPGEASTARRYKPSFPKEPVAGYDTVQVNPDGSVAKQGSYQPGVRMVKRPYYTNTNTLTKKAGPAGQESTQWNAATVAKAKQIQLANYGKPGYIARSLVPGGLEGGTTSVTKAITRGAQVASNVLPGGGVGEAAGLLAGLKGLKVVRGVKDVAEVAPAAQAAAHTTEGGAAVRESLKGAPNVRAGQAGDFSVQRRARFAKAESIYRDTSLTPEERQAHALGALKGSLDRPVYTGFKKMTPETVTNIKAQIMEHPTLKTGQKTKLLTSLDRGVAGIVPTAGEHKLFTQVFGKETALGIAKAAKTGRWKNIVTNVVNVPRTLQSTLDMSAFLRQGAVALARHPYITGKNFKTLIHSFASNEAALKVESDIASHPNYPLMQQGKVALTGSGDLQRHEEQFAANMLENIGGNKNPVHWSSRSYSSFLNKTRADIFNHLLDVAHTQGHNIHDEKFLKDLGNMVNVFTGRGSLPGSWERAANVFNGIFFSPRLMASRVQMAGQPFNPALHPFVRRQYQRAAAQGLGALLTVLGLAKANGLNVGTDPTSADFGKIKFGNTRVDLGAGFLQYGHLLAQLATGKSTSSTSGKVSNIYSGKYAQRSAHDVVSGFFEGKLSPPLATLDDALRQQTNFGKFNVWQEMINHLTPLSGQDVYGVATNRSKGGLGAAEVAGAGILSLFGGGVQTYGPKAPKRTGGSSSGSSYDFTPSGSGGGSSYDFTPAP
jgi:hypothetical protein